jgi:hypothetical protein
MATPVRPSSFHLAKKCKRAPWLSTKFPEGNTATEAGLKPDAQVSRGLQSDEGLVLWEGEELLPETEQILKWVRRTFLADAEFFVQRRVELRDPSTGELLTAGTPDLVVLLRDQRRIVIVDWKSIGQMWAGHLPPPDQNMQQLIYGVAASLELSAELGVEIDSFKVYLACFDKDGVREQASGEKHQQDWWDIIDQVKAMPLVDLDAPEPEAFRGDHCVHCYQRHHCSAYLLPERPDMPVALVPFAQPGELTPDAAAAGLAWLDLADMAIKRAKELRDIVEDNINAFTALHGPVVVGDRQYGPREKRGSRRGPTLGELEAGGHADMIKPPKVSIVYDWMPAGAPVAIVPAGEEPAKPAKRSKKAPAAVLIGALDPPPESGRR